MIEIQELDQKTINRFWGKVDKSGDCWNWIGGSSPAGYGRFTILMSGTKKFLLSHRISYFIHTGSLPNGMLVCHSCDNPSCVNPDHLFLGTYRDNVMDAVNKGRIKIPFGINTIFPKGEKHPEAKITKDQAIEIKERLSNGERQIDIAEDYPISRWMISKIARGRCWTHV